MSRSTQTLNTTDNVFDICERKYGELTCKIMRYVNDGIHPSEPCKEPEQPKMELVRVEKHKNRHSNNFNAMLFIFDVLTLGFLHGYFSK